MEVFKTILSGLFNVFILIISGLFNVSILIICSSIIVIIFGGPILLSKISEWYLLLYTPHVLLALYTIGDA